MSVQQIEDALQRQVLEGGEIDTALLELGAALENTLSSYRAASFGLPAASREALMSVAADVLSLVPTAVARKHRVVPLVQHGQVLVLATGQPTSGSDARAIQQAVGRPVQWCIATDVRVDAALARHYGIEIAPRMRRLAEQLERWPAGELSSVEPMLMSNMPSPSTGLLGMLDDSDDAEAAASGASELSSAVALPPPTIVSERGVGQAALTPPPSVGVGRVVQVQPPSRGAGPQPSAAEAPDTRPMPEAKLVGAGLPPIEPSPAAGPSASQRAASMAARPRPRRTAGVPMGPLTVGVARELLDQAEDRDAVVEVFFSFARQYFDATALFAVREDRALGFESHNMPAVEDIREVAVLLEPRSTLDELSRGLLPRVVDLSLREADHALALALDRMYDQPCALIPVCIRQRVVSLVYGDRRGEAFSLSDLGALIELLPWVSQAFERIIRNRKTQAMQSRRLPPMAAPSPVFPVAMPEAPEEPRSRTPAPRASWSALAMPMVVPPRASMPPASVAGVFPGEPRSLRPHEIPTPAERPSRASRPSRPTDTLAGIAVSGPKHTSTARAMPSVGAEAGSSSQPPSRQARDALGALGVPRSAPPPPMVPRHDATGLPGAHTAADRILELERSQTVRLPAQAGDLTRLVAQPSAAETSAPEAALPPPAARLSKPPPGAGAYRSATAEHGFVRDSPHDAAHDASHDSADHDTSPSFRAVGPQAGPIDAAVETRPIRRSRPAMDPGAPMPDPSEPPVGARGYRSRPPARNSKQPPGAGSYKVQDAGREVISFAPPPSEPAGRSSAPPSSYHSDHAPSDVVALPPPPRVPEVPTYEDRRRRKSAEITQPLGPRPNSAQPHAPEPEPAQHLTDARREQADDATPDAEVVSMSTAVRNSMRPPAPASEPSIIVDTATQAQQLVIDLCRCGPDDEARSVQLLLRVGDPALAVLAEHFPGPLWFDRRRPHPRLPLGRDVSAIARALSAFGERAVPYLQGLLSAASPDTRFYATLLASDQIHAGLLPALAERALDVDPQVRLIIRDTLPQYRRTPGFADVVAMLRARAADGGAVMQDRLAAIDALSMLRDPDSVPLFIEQNAADDKQLSVPAHRALVAITGQDFGPVIRKWSAWYEDNRRSHRAQWLIESLMHPEQVVRATAGLELQKLTQVYYGFVAGAPKRDRERAQKRYRDWWELEGSKRFG
ncbi:MAG TPA: hypothetical protein VF331_11545 [Polyangiales bacterium]